MKTETKTRLFAHGWVAVTRRGKRKLFRTYDEACAWLDQSEPAQRGFVIEEEPNLPHNSFVRHA